MLLFYAGVSLRDGALKSGPKACRERPTVKEKAASPFSVRSALRGRNRALLSVGPVDPISSGRLPAYSSSGRASGWASIATAGKNPYRPTSTRFVNDTSSASDPSGSSGSVFSMMMT